MNLDHVRDKLRLPTEERSNTVHVDGPSFQMHDGITAHSAINVVGTDACCHDYIAMMDQLGKVLDYEMRRTRTNQGLTSKPWFSASPSTNATGDRD